MMEGEPQSQEKMTIEQAQSEIETIWQQISQFGGVSNEHDLILDLENRVKEGRISPESAVTEAHQIMHGKNGFDTQYR